MQKTDLLEKIYDKYRMEINRKDKLESKSLGYYTVTGIFFAAFLVIEPLLIQNGLLPKCAIRDSLLSINLILVLLYLTLLVITIYLLHSNYTPKNRMEFSPIENWNTLINLDDNNYIEAIKKNLTEIILSYEISNGKMAHKIKLVNNLCIIDAMVVIIIFLIFVVQKIS